MTRKGGLGKGLDALIPSKTQPQDSGQLYIATDKIVPNPRQPRLAMNTDDLEDLANSIREHGILQPLIVSRSEDGDTFILIAGERRWRAAQLIGLDTIPVIVRQASDQERLELALIENVQRADLNALEKAEAYHQLVEDFGLTHEEISRRVGKSRVAITNTIRLLNLPEIVRQALSSERITEGHARALLGLTNPQAQAAALDTILRWDMTVRQAEELVDKLLGRKPHRTAKKAATAEASALEERLRTALGTRVSLHQGKKGGTLTFHYYSDEELNALIALILKE